MNKNLYTLILFSFLVSSQIFAQNIAITDDDTYTANSSAMLDVKSITKGLLIPRLTSAQRTAISSPATGLLVFDSTLNSFMYWNGTTWTNLTSGSASGIWSYNSPNVYLTNTNNRVGVGTTSPYGKMEVKADASITTNTPIFQVTNNNGDTVFAVYPQGVRVNVQDDPGKVSGSKGGFAVGGFTPSKGTFTNEYLRVTPDSVRIYIEDDPAKASGSKGGFAVGGFSPSKTTAAINYLDLTPDNYFIGHESGLKTTSGLYNSFLGYQAGRENEDGYSNTFLGYKSGYLNVSGYNNVFVGSSTGYNNFDGYNNAFVGTNSGINNTTGFGNTFLGALSGAANNEGNVNTFIGYSAGFQNTVGDQNIFVGSYSGMTNSTGSYNSFIGFCAGQNNTTGNFNSFLGNVAGNMNTTGNYNTFTGTNSGRNNINGSNNSFYGTSSGILNSSGMYNSFFGFSCGFNNTTGGSNSFFGSQCGTANTEGYSNSFFGTAAGLENTTGNSNSYVGNQAGYGSTTGSFNSCLGNQAGYSIKTGTNDVYIGNYSGYSTQGGNHNTFVGTGSGSSAISATQSTYIGAYAGQFANGANNVFVGYFAGANESGSNKLYIENSTSATPLIWGDFSTDNVVINGNFKVTGILYDKDTQAGTSGQVLSSTGTGVDWITLPAGLSGSGTANQVAFWTGTSSLSGNSKLYWDNTNSRLGINTTPAYMLHVVDNTASYDGPAIYGVMDVTDNWGVGIKGKGRYRGVVGEATSASGSQMGVMATASGAGTGNRYGAYATATGGDHAYGIYASASSATIANYAAYLDGSVAVTGNLNVTGTVSKGGGSFKIDHPLDPENKYLYHSFVESPDMKNIYDGIAIFDANGMAEITLPDYFEALNKDFRYVFSPIGAPMPNLYISQEVQGNKFTIAGGVPGKKVSWQVTGIRKDPFAEKNRIPVEVEKSTEEKGYYLYPDAYNLPQEKGMQKKFNNNNK